MALTPDEARAHIETWEQKLDLPFYAHRKSWPSRLFHHSPLENAVEILRDGNLRSRSDPNLRIERDVAGDGVIDLRLDAHKYVRLYYRPRTPTQFHIEGVRKKSECQFGKQAPILYMFVLSATPVLTRNGTVFSDQNMQRSAAQVGQDYKFFASVPWDKVYHEGGLSGDHSIIGHRCAEVLAISPLALNECLQWIYCRSEAERDTLLYYLPDLESDWRARVRVSDDIKVFNRLLAYVEHVNLASDGIVFELHPRNDSQNIEIRVVLEDGNGAVIAKFENANFRPIPEDAKRWRVPSQIQPGKYIARIWIEGELAFHSELSFGDDLV